MKNFNSTNGSLSFLMMNLKNELIKEFGYNRIYLEPNLFGHNEFHVLLPLHGERIDRIVGFIDINMDNQWELSFYTEEYKNSMEQLKQLQTC